MNGSEGAVAGEPVSFVCSDGFVLRGHLWHPVGAAIGTVVINPATGVLARYYHRYASFLAENGLAAITFDYRGIGLSRPAELQGRRLRRLSMRWSDWGTRDVDAVLRFARSRALDTPLSVVGHSIGGVLIGYAASARLLDRILTVGAQYAYWPDYARARRGGFLLRWHVVMPILTLLCGYFPGRRLGWLEDLPKGVALDWACRGERLEQGDARADARADVLARFAAVRAPILAVSTTDDPFATLPATRRMLGYFSGSDRRIAMLTPASLDASAIGHFALFNSKHREPFWSGTLRWLVHGEVAWPTQAVGNSAPSLSEKT